MGAPIPCVEHRCPLYAEPGKSRCRTHHNLYERERQQWATGRRGSAGTTRADRRKTFARDHWKCVRCGKHRNEVTKLGGKLHCHHEDGNSRNDDPANLITLCEWCHKAEHARQRAELRDRFR